MGILSRFPYKLINKKKFEVELGKQIRDAVAEELNWKDVNDVGDSSDKISSRSIFDVYEAIYDVSSTEKKKFKDNVVEAEDWLSSGLFIGQDPQNVQTYEKLMLQQAASKWQWINFPIARSVIENIRRYCLGRGVKVDCPVQEIQNVIKNFWRDNEMESRVKNCFRSILMDGEYFFALFERDVDGPSFDSEQDSVLAVRRIHSTEVKSIEYDVEDFETRLSYNRVKPVNITDVKESWYLDCSYPYGEEEEFGLPTLLNKPVSKYETKSEEGVRVLMFKNSPAEDQRGRVFLETVLRWNRVFMDYMYDRGQLNHFRCKVFLIETRTSKTGRIMGTSAVERIPRGGMKLIETADRKYRFEAPNTGAGDAYTDTKSLAYLIGSGVSMPIHILLMNAENENYASIREAGNPFAQMVQDLQDDFGEMLRKLIRHLLKVCVIKGLLEPEYEVEYYAGDGIGEVVDIVAKGLVQGQSFNNLMEQAKGFLEKEVKTVKTLNLPINIVFPEIVHTDREKIAKAIEIYLKYGLISRQTAITLIGQDPEVEKARIDMEKEADLQKREDEFNRLNTGQPFKEPEGEEEEEE